MHQSHRKLPLMRKGYKIEYSGNCIHVLPITISIIKVEYRITSKDCRDPSWLWSALKWSLPNLHISTFEQCALSLKQADIMDWQLSSRHVILLMLMKGVWLLQKREIDVSGDYKKTWFGIYSTTPNIQLNSMSISVSENGSFEVSCTLQGVLAEPVQCCHTTFIVSFRWSSSKQSTAIGWKSSWNLLANSLFCRCASKNGRSWAPKTQIPRTLSPWQRDRAAGLGFSPIHNTALKKEKRMFSKYAI